MPASSNQLVVSVEAPARLHFGVLDLRGDLGRWFGGIGTAAPGPTLLISGCRSNDLEVRGPDSDRVAATARRWLGFHGLSGGASIQVKRSLPAHVGLGSGTQLALGVARLMAELYGVATEIGELTRALGRGDRSAIGTYAFCGGGLIVEGGRYRNSEAVAPLITRLKLPANWWCVVGVPHTGPGVHGDVERAAFARLPAPAERDVERVAHLVLMALLPAVVDGDLVSFGEALTAIQSITGRWFAPVQGGTFARGASEELINAMVEWGAVGVGQSSWGPTVYGLAEGEARGRQLADQVRSRLGEAGTVYDGPFPQEGARVWSESVERRVRGRVPSSYHS